MLANKILKTDLNEAGYYQAATTPGLWKQKWCPILFIFAVDDFGIKYAGKRHIHHLRKTIQSHYTITKYWEGKFFSGINLNWEYTKLAFRLSMNGYIQDILYSYQHTPPKKPQISPHKHT